MSLKHLEARFGTSSAKLEPSSLLRLSGSPCGFELALTVTLYAHKNWFLVLPGGGSQHLSPGLQCFGAEEHSGLDPLLLPLPHEPGQLARPSLASSFSELSGNWGTCIICHLALLIPVVLCVSQSKDKPRHRCLLACFLGHPS